MKCPSCTDVALTMSDRQGVEIDYCPECRGVWLDRGESRNTTAAETSDSVPSRPSGTFFGKALMCPAIACG